jgi:BirA family biotin operon repressor/biotin-[acetyl-CoA-carboxylase] ligase
MIIRRKEIDSTNKYALALFQKGGEEAVSEYDNFMITAERQNAGRGRYGRAWYSPPGNLYASYIISEPEFPPFASLWICGLAVLDTIKKTAPEIKPWLKWPNDVYITASDGQNRKISGLLAETFMLPGKSGAAAVVCGIGVNINMSEEEVKLIDKPASSLSAETGRVYDVESFTDTIYEFIREYRRKIEDDFDAMYLEWRNANKLIGMQIKIQLDSGDVIEGKVDDVCKDGSLVFRKTDGELIKVVSGDIIFI